MVKSSTENLQSQREKMPNTPCIGIIVAILLIVVRRTLIVVLT